MAKLKNTLFGNISGKLGNVVFKKNKRKFIVTKYQPYIKDKKSLVQKIQRNKITVLSSFIGLLNNKFLSLFYSGLSSKKSIYSQAIKDNLKAVQDNGIINFHNLSFGKPSLDNIIITEATYNPFIDQITLDFDKTNLANNSLDEIGFFSFIGKGIGDAGLSELNLDNDIYAQWPVQFRCKSYHDNGVGNDEAGYVCVFTNVRDGAVIYCRFSYRYNL